MSKVNASFLSSLLSNITITFQHLCIAIGLAGKRKSCINSIECYSRPHLKVNPLVDGLCVKFRFSQTWVENNSNNSNKKVDLLDYFSFILGLRWGEWLEARTSSAASGWVHILSSFPPLANTSLNFAWNLLWKCLQRTKVGSCRGNLTTFSKGYLLLIFSLVAWEQCVKRLSEAMSSKTLMNLPLSGSLSDFLTEVYWQEFCFHFAPSLQL